MVRVNTFSDVPADWFRFILEEIAVGVSLSGGGVVFAGI